MLKITEVNINSASWSNVAQVKDWNTVRLCNPDWNTIKMTALTSSQLRIEVAVIENTWELLRDAYSDWESISELSTWADIRIF
ncbi:hypothetical protein [Anaerocolumna chitinilytica]|uniref:Uncharacterized protein n=1 Tax=Anaerocolumna chitinilytica TaxID=1727145 RepID=A0A7M3S9Y3_9FIRM|nr:hypothetical protein [Anaerocolumna chitinilytica]BCK01401.1 hypothetical protein bsdcttw_44410 [Anaerocolumna chitinilytica]